MEKHFSFWSLPNYQDGNLKICNIIAQDEYERFRTYLLVCFILDELIKNIIGDRRKDDPRGVMLSIYKVSRDRRIGHIFHRWDHELFNRVIGLWVGYGIVSKAENNYYRLTNDAIEHRTTELISHVDVHWPAFLQMSFTTRNRVTYIKENHFLVTVGASMPSMGKIGLEKYLLSIDFQSSFMRKPVADKPFTLPR